MTKKKVSKKKKDTKIVTIELPIREQIYWLQLSNELKRNPELSKRLDRYRWVNYD